MPEPTPFVERLCQHCGGLIAVRNPTGKCDHLYWPTNLTDDAKRANGLVEVSRVVTEWVSEPADTRPED